MSDYANLNENEENVEDEEMKESEIQQRFKEVDDIITMNELATDPHLVRMAYSWNF